MQLLSWVLTFRDMERFDGQVVVVTGASSGVGRAVARAFGAVGARVGLVARNPDALENAAREIAQAGGEAAVFPVDVADAEAVDGVARAVVERWGRLDVWVNNAMVTVMSPALEMTAARVPAGDRGDVSRNGSRDALRAPADAAARPGARSSRSARRWPTGPSRCRAPTAPRRPPFAGSPTRSAPSCIHDRSKVKVCMLQLPAVNTPQFEVARTRLPHRPMPVPPVFQPEVIARAALYAAKHPTRELWIAGSTWKAILSAKVAGPIGDRVLATEGYSAQQTDQPDRPATAPTTSTATCPGTAGRTGRSTTALAATASSSGPGCTGPSCSAPRPCSGWARRCSPAVALRPGLPSATVTQIVRPTLPLPTAPRRR